MSTALLMVSNLFLALRHQNKPDFLDSIKILIVEDELMVAANLAMILEDKGYEPYDAAGTKEEALKMLEEIKPDIAILDINLHGKAEGIEIGAYIKEHLNIPFIFLTSNSDKDTIDAAKKVNPSAYLVKPFKADDIFAAIEIAVANFSGEEYSAALEPENNEEKISIFSGSIFIKSNNRYVKTAIADITYMQAVDKYVEIFTRDKKRYIVRSSLDAILHKFTPYHFIRVHKSYVINPQYLEQINGHLIVVDQLEIPVGRSFRDGLIKLIDTLH
jgi:two-component system response regulator LytT